MPGPDYFFLYTKNISSCPMERISRMSRLPEMYKIAGVELSPKCAATRRGRLKTCNSICCSGRQTDEYADSQKN